MHDLGLWGYLWRTQRLAVMALLVSALTLAVFGTRFTVRLIYFSDPDHVQQPLEGWMTLGYVARSWEVPRQSLHDWLHLPPDTPRRATIREIADNMGLSPADLGARLLAKANSLHGSQP